MLPWAVGDDHKEDKNKIGHAASIDNSQTLTNPMNQFLFRPILENAFHPVIWKFFKSYIH